MKALLEATQANLQQLRALIVAVAADDYARPCAGASSGVGTHVRHILDHYRALRAGLASGCVDYNCRSRGSVIEQEPAAALSQLTQLQAWLAEGVWQEEPLEIETEISVAASVNLRLASSLSRELCYLINHTVHHLAYSRLVAAQLGYELDTRLGLAPATATFLRQ
ncbi:DinB family protein [Halioxenophilus sp. WMMB6]|uniref:DinB family protein n=1 Tax=Halioxenophilus sp. WMMB6 TaxID=3073815 RepID=UPI00295EBD90|nr:DinB family protein [Halioxenophilus sp. WMMB6]